MKFKRLNWMLLLMSVASVVHAADTVPPIMIPTQMGAIERSEAMRATELLDRAIDYLQRYGPEKAFRAFNDRKSVFVNNEYYVFVVGFDGTLYASGGEPSWLLRSSALDLHDAAGKYFVREMLDMAKTKESGAIEYNWLNHIDNRVEIKTTQFRKMGNFIVCVGYYVPRASI